MTQPVKLYICSAPADTKAVRDLEKRLLPLERLGLLQIWHQGKLLPGDTKAQEVAIQLDQAQAIIMLISSNFFTPDHYDSAEMIRTLQILQEARVRVIPVILEYCLWKESALGELLPLPEGGKPVGSEDKAWQNVVIGIQKIAVHLQTEQAKEEQSANPTARSKARTKARPLGGAVLTVESPKAPQPPRIPPPTRPKAPPKPEPPKPDLLSGIEPEPATPEAMTAMPAYDQDFGKLQREINQISLDILVWEPTQSSHKLVAEERRVIYHTLQGKQHQCWLGTQLQVPSGLSLQDREIEQARATDMTILLVEAPAIGEMHEFCNDYDEKLFEKTFCFYPEGIKSPPGSWGLDETIFEGFHLHYYQDDDITNCRLREKVLRCVESRRGCRFRMQRRRGR